MAARYKPLTKPKPAPVVEDNSGPSREFKNRIAPVSPECVRCKAKHSDDFGAFVRWSIAELVAGRYQLMCSCGRYRFEAEMKKRGTDEKAESRDADFGMFDVLQIPPR